MTCGNTADAFASPSPLVGASATCDKTDIASISASSSNNGLPPTNAIDGSLGTYWSSSNIGASILSDLGSSKAVCSISIVWNHGDSRQYRFLIDLSNDGQSFTTVGYFLSSETTEPQTYDIPDTNARYVRITVFGNTLDTSAELQN